MLKEDLKSISLKCKEDSEINTKKLYDIKIDDKNKKIIIDLNYDLYINIIGELGISTLNNFLCLDTINSNLMLNSRASKELFNTPEAITYRNNIINEQLNKKQICSEHNEITELNDRINELERELLKIKELVYGK